MSISAKDVMALRQKTGAGMMDCKKALAETNGDVEAAIKYLREKGMASAAKRQGREANEGRVGVKISDDGKTAVMVEINSETDFVARNEEFVALVDKYVEMAAGLGDKAVNGIIPVEAFDMTALTELAGKIGENLTLRRGGYLTTEGRLESYIHPGDMLGVLLELNGEGASSDAGQELAHDLTLQIAAASPQYVTSDEVPAEVIEKEKEIYATQMRNEGKPENIIEKIATGKLNKFFEEICLVNQPYVKEPKMKVSDRIKEASNAAGAEVTVSRFLRFKVGEGA